ncbi:MAG: tannase/feruloyl esterase family alpha/beta hydrolase [Sphingomonadales bacterium]|nr:tannase/feruloyl esterase family alpha/beta hydrolase [Sphingomonadales bacterium]MBD3773097.1 tannase/feruloyl esterase family alpha/beta hydrolase [Paracoccaceae bacterium]
MKRVNSYVAAAMLALLAGGAAHAGAAGRTRADRSCAAIARADFGPAIAIVSARHVSAQPGGTTPDGRGGTVGAALPAHCLVDGWIDRRSGVGGKPYGIHFQLALPDAWSGRFLLMGGGGLNGTVYPPIGPVAAGDLPALARGFAVASHDSGHEGSVWDMSFMADQRAALDFAESSVRTVTLASRDIVARYYGRPAAHSYMTGCSTGGREGMLAMQRYPELFDGIVIGAPAMRTGNSNLGMNYAAAMFNRAAPRDAAGQPLVERIFPDSDRQTILAGLLAQCDARDGLADGMVMDVAGCRFDPAKLRCTGEKRDGCLAPAQVEALKLAFAGPKDASGRPAYAPAPYDTGIVFAGEGGIPGYLPTGRPGPFGPPSRALDFDVDAGLAKIREDEVQQLTDTAGWTNLSTYLGHGGKVLFYHGVSDPWFSAYDTWDYWQRAAEANGPAWAEGSRFYMVPGMSHCRGGNAYDSFDLLGPLVDWVEQDTAPPPVPAGRSDGQAGTKPLCPHPAYAHYMGGDPALAASYACRLPAQ